MNTFFRATLTNDTPVFIGGYDTNYARDNITEGLRTQSLKGFIRYWMRVYLAGAGYNLNDINSKIVQLLGGNYNGKMYSSKIRLQCYNMNDEHSKIDYKFKDIPRIKLLQLRSSNRYINFAAKLEAKVELQGNLDDKDKRLIIGSLITGLLLSGLGKMSRRGFGCFSINIEDDDTRLFRTKVNELFLQDVNDEKRISIIKDIIKYTRDSLDIKSKHDGNDLPDIHSLSHCKIFYIPLKQQQILREIEFFQGFTVRNRRGNDKITKNHLAWFMGLPRSQKGTGSQKVTGYSSEDSQRRASAMFIAIHKYFALVSFFKSKDWPKEIIWRGGRSNPETIQPCNLQSSNNINNAFDETPNSFKSYIKKNRDYTVIEIA